MPTYRLIPGAEIVVFHSSLNGLRQQVICGAKRAAVSDKTAALLHFLTNERRHEELLGFCEHAGIREPAETLEQFLALPSLASFVQTVESDKGSFVDPEKVDKRALPKGSFRLRFIILPSGLVNMLSAPLAWLCAPAAVAIGILFIVATHCLLYFGHTPQSHSPAHFDMALAIFLVYLSVLFHEIGHAAASVRSGSKPGPIGAGIYFLWPVLYTDLTESWSLPRHLRAGIDLAGIYFQLLFSGAALILGHYYLPRELHVVTSSILLASIINLNPFLKFDGYWLLTDLMGVPHLRLISTETLWHKARCLPVVRSLAIKRFPLAKSTVLESMQPTLYVTLIVYGLLNVVVMAYWTLRIFKFARYAVKAAFIAIHASVLQLISHPLSLPSLHASLTIVLAAAGSIEMLLLLGFRMCRLGLGLKEHSIKWLRQ